MMRPFFLPLHVVLQRQAPVQRCLERLLYVWAVKHPASGYVQGINDLATPLLVVFLSAALLPPKESPSSSSPSSSFNEAGSSSAAFAAATSNSSNSSGRCPLTTAVECLDSGKLPVEVLAAAEADTYWCLTKLLDNIQVMLLILHPPSVGCLSSLLLSCFLIRMYVSSPVWCMTYTHVFVINFLITILGPLHGGAARSAAADLQVGGVGAAD